MVFTPNTTLLAIPKAIKFVSYSYSFSSPYLENNDPVLFVDGAQLQLLLQNVVCPNEDKSWDVAD